MATAFPGSNLVRSIADIFRPVQAVQPINSQGNMQQAMQQANPGAAAVVPPPGTSMPTVQQEPPPDPLASMADLWKTDPNNPPQTDPLSGPLLNADPAKIREAATKIDFVGQVPQDVMQKVMAGNDPAALMQLINHVSQTTLAAAAQLSSATIEQAALRNNQRIDQALPGRVRQIQLRSMQSENPVLQHPAAQPFLNMVRSQIAMKDSSLSAAEINRRADAILGGFANAVVAPSESATAARLSAEGTDWDAWVSSDPGTR